MTPPHLLSPLFSAAASLAVSLSAIAQTAPPAEPPPPAPARPPAASNQQVEISGGRETDADQRRQSTAAKIVIGRDEIERFGDSSVSEVLKRLPGITMPGAPGRGGPPRMRGLGGGYTQILIDGQRAPAGFSLDQLTPEQLERIEILRAPTAETGARAIGGTINIVTREGYKARLNDLRFGFGSEAGKVTPGVFWTHNNSQGNFIYNLTAGLFSPHSRPESQIQTIDEDPATGAVTREQTERVVTDSRRLGTNLNARLQWRGEGGDLLMLMPAVFASKGEASTRFSITDASGVPAPLYDHGTSDLDNDFTTLRLNGTWRTRVPLDFRLELNGGGVLSRGHSHSLRREFDLGNQLLRTEQTDASSLERSLNLNGKLTKLLEGDHSFVSGWELENLRRDETRVTLSNGAPQLGDDFDDNLAASSLRLAVYAQDEWAFNPNWSAHAGLRLETITTRGDDGADGSRPRNKSSVTTPLLHFLYKPDPKARDQVRISLTRSYKSPTLSNLIARPSISSRYPVPGLNTPTSPDRIGNPELKPELATGIDVAVERYLSDGGVLSANVFMRRISDYIRNVTALEKAAWNGNNDRYVSRPLNVGRASTAGIELEAKFRLDQMITDAPRTEIRANLSLFRSRVDEVPGPDNRLDQQPKGTANFGADHRFRGTPLTLGASLNVTPSYRTQVSAEQSVTAPTKRQLDMFALWVFNPNAQLRLNFSNLSPQDYVTGNLFDADRLRERTITTTRTDLNVRVGLELKL